MLELKPVVHAVLEEYTLPWQGVHGVAHWARVLETGLRLAERNGAQADVVRLFAVFHDCQRVTEKTDPSHGIRGAALATELRGRLFDLDDDDFDLLFVACSGHMDNPNDDDPTVQTCWDADRLDFGRVGGKIDPLWLGECTVQQSDVVEWARRRARARAIPALIERSWGIPTDGWQKPERVGRRKKAR